ncbi:60S ribosomal protein L18-2 [Acorus calamus]|uniref:60S ribosomal protein L18-2 n=1 Tax=Acorus calamus TaxID=4465 RepID=A0AAV9FKQ0_ACOCL|nr:60S ribosomal protein L18-2 [Acorus calamus]
MRWTCDRRPVIAHRTDRKPHEDKIAVVVRYITDDTCVYEVPALKVLLRGPKNVREAVKAFWKGSRCATQSYQALCSLEGKEV